MSLLRVLAVVFCVLTFSWLVIQLVLLKLCFVDEHLSTNAQYVCQRDKNLLLLQVLQMVRDPECVRVLQLVKAAVSNEHLPTIFVVTPTYARPVQKAELIRMSHTLLLVPKLYWIVVEDSINKTSLVKNFLAHCGIPHTHLNIPTPEPLKTNVDDPNWLKPRGVLQRNRALAWMRRQLNLKVKGVVYFADDDNTYDLQLFEQMRYTHKVSVWPVGLVGGLMVERPLVENGKVVGWNTLWKADRPFPLDMAGFAVNLTLLLQHKHAAFSVAVPRGYQESKLLKDLVTVSELEPKADNCTKVLVWHTRTEKPKLKQERKLQVHSNDGIEV